MSALASGKVSGGFIDLIGATEVAFVAQAPQLEGHLALRLRQIPDRGLYHVRGNDALVRVDISPIAYAHPQCMDILRSCLSSSIRVRRGLNLTSDLRRV